MSDSFTTVRFIVYHPDGIVRDIWVTDLTNSHTMAKALTFFMLQYKVSLLSGETISIDIPKNKF